MSFLTTEYLPYYDDQKLYYIYLSSQILDELDQEVKSKVIIDDNIFKTIQKTLTNRGINLFDQDYVRKMVEENFRLFEIVHEQLEIVLVDHNINLEVYIGMMSNFLEEHSNALNLYNLIPYNPITKTDYQTKFIRLGNLDINSFQNLDDYNIALYMISCVKINIELESFTGQLLENDTERVSKFTNLIMKLAMTRFPNYATLIQKLNSTNLVSSYPNLTKDDEDWIEFNTMWKERYYPKLKSNFELVPLDNLILNLTEEISQDQEFLTYIRQMWFNQEISNQSEDNFVMQVYLIQPMIISIENLPTLFKTEITKKLQCSYVDPLAFQVKNYLPIGLRTFMKNHQNFIKNGGDPSYFTAGSGAPGNCSIM